MQTPYTNKRNPDRLVVFFGDLNYYSILDLFVVVVDWLVCFLCLIDWLVRCLCVIYWLVCFLCLIDWLVRCLCYMNCWLTSPLSRFFELLIDLSGVSVLWIVDWLVRCLSLIDRLFCISVPWIVDWLSLIDWLTSPLFLFYELMID